MESCKEFSRLSKFFGCSSKCFRDKWLTMPKSLLENESFYSKFREFFTTPFLFYVDCDQWRMKAKISRVQGFDWPRRRLCGRAHQTQDNFGRLQILDYLVVFFKIIWNPTFKFRTIGGKHNCLAKFAENFEYFWWKFNTKVEFLCIFGNSCC